MRHPRRFLKTATPLVGALALMMALASVVLAHPESEGAHPGGCIVTVEPGSVGVGQQFTVAGNFGNASIFLVAAGSTIAEGATPLATTPAGQSFSVTFVAETSDVGSWTVWGLIEGSECGDSDSLMVATLPNTAAQQPSWVVLIGALALLATLALGGVALRSRRLG